MFDVLVLGFSYRSFIADFIGRFKGRFIVELIKRPIKMYRLLYRSCIGIFTGCSINIYRSFIAESIKDL